MLSGYGVLKGKAALVREGEEDTGPLFLPKPQEFKEKQKFLSMFIV